jgi:hypothetical protein
MTDDMFQNLKYWVADIWDFITYPYYRLKAKKLKFMGIDETVLFLEKYGFSVLKVERMIPTRPDINAGKIVFSGMGQVYTIQFQNARFKNLWIKDSKDYHRLCWFAFTYMEYDFCWPMSELKNDNIAFSANQRFRNISKEWGVDKDNCFRILAPYSYKDKK